MPDQQQPVPPPPGWYPHGNGQRYWDGTAWTEHSAPVAPPSVPGKTRARWYKRWWGIALLSVPVLFVLMVILALSGGGTSSTDLSTAPADAAKYEEVSAREYALIVKDPDAHEGERIIVYGIVTQADAATGDEDIRVSSAAQRHRQDYQYEHNTMLTTSNSDIFADVLEGDLVKIYAEVIGSVRYNTQVGGNTTVPQLNAGIIEVIRSE